MADNKARTQMEVRQEEEVILQEFQSELDEKIKKCEERIKNEKDVLRDGQFHHEERGNVFGLANSNIGKLNDEVTDYKIRRSDTYLARVDRREEDGIVSYYLSESEGAYLSKIEVDGHEACIVGFGDGATSIARELFERFYTKSSEPVDGKEVLLRRRTEVKGGILTEVEQHYPMLSKVDTNGVSDEYLIRVLEENRGQAGIDSIIRSIQAKQFQIISSDIHKDLVVQGCAGSGKTQILILRLFFNKKSIAQMGKDKLLIITPSKLFEGHISGLMQHYKILAEQKTIAEYYWELLNQYDNRFKSRQYHIQYMEEALPDSYLQAVYSSPFIESIRSEIDACIYRHTTTVRGLLGEEDRYFPIDMDEIARLSSLLDAEIARRRDIHQELDADEEFSALKKSAKELQRKKIRLSESCEKVQESVRHYTEDCQQNQGKIKELQRLLEKLQSQINMKLISEIETYMDRARNPRLAWSEQLTIMREASLYYRNQDRQYRSEQQETVDNCAAELSAVFNISAPPEKFIAALTRAGDTLKRTAEKNCTDLRDVELALSDVERQMTEHLELLGIRKVDTDEELLRAMEKEAYLLHRFEITVFEEAVWDKLLPMKQKYNVAEVRTVSGEKGEENKKRELYKLELAFFLEIYRKLYTKSKLDQKRMICIDEGQSLSEFEYELLKGIQSKAVFNVYGDLRQQLAPGSGVKDWRKLGIENYFELNENYRNAVGIVNHCNRYYKVQMKPFGQRKKSVERIEWDQCFQAVDRLSKHVGNAAIIVKNRNIYNTMCEQFPEIRHRTRLWDSETDTLQEDKTPVYTVNVTRGLEFPCVFVVAHGMNINQRYLACTRAMGELIYCGEEE